MTRTAAREIAIQLGFFREAGIEIELSTAEGSDTSMSTVLSGSAMIGFGSLCESGIFFSPLALRIAPLRYAYGVGMMNMSISGVNRFAMMIE